MKLKDYTGGIYFKHYGACIVTGEEVEVSEVDYDSLANAIGSMDDDFIDEFCKWVRRYQKAHKEQSK